MTEQTLAIVKPDAMKARAAGKILDMILEAGFGLSAVRLVHLTREQAEGFYQVHRERPFFPSLTAFMTEGPVLVMVLEAENAIARWRDLMGPTNPAEASEGTIRKRFGAGIARNAVHGSDAPETARFEIAYFFSELDRVRR
ncbi:MAG: nucleoside-diphosphate kinase [Acidobacteria bacterium]|nr:nucleoside-diphosphate kinase [Acidobacteriota bacterium]